MPKPGDPGVPVIIEAVPMVGKYKLHVPGGAQEPSKPPDPLRQAQTSLEGIPEGYVAVLMPAKEAYELVTLGKALPCIIDSVEVRKP